MQLAKIVQLTGSPGLPFLPAGPAGPAGPGAPCNNYSMLNLHGHQTFILSCSHLLPVSRVVLESHSLPGDPLVLVHLEHPAVVWACIKLEPSCYYWVNLSSWYVHVYLFCIYLGLLHARQWVSALAITVLSYSFWSLTLIPGFPALPAGPGSPGSPLSPFSPCEWC